ncbi:hypothetical protein CCUS01_16076 [Colletotrichum cuscutae]|uniref:Uncharacterized protein n=1 Tax=Colletotrichum cuscutae TaxID=1209917 RepID=A0AAI9VEY1_9PEZI|nr:hypothetical protein CCUS01_16076 [Colletotrichum cuscutae]
MRLPSFSFANFFSSDRSRAGVCGDAKTSKRTGGCTCPGCLDPATPAPAPGRSGRRRRRGARALNDVNQLHVPGRRQPLAPVSWRAHCSGSHRLGLG